MRIQVEDEKNGMIDISVGIKMFEIDSLIKALEGLKLSREHFHLRSIANSRNRISDVEIYLTEDSDEDNAEVDGSIPIEPNRK